MSGGNPDGKFSDQTAPIRLIDLGTVDPWASQAVYHAVAELMAPTVPDTILLARPNAPYLCLGYHDRFDSVLDRRACRRLNLPVLRRQVGGGTTYLDAGQIFYQCVFHHTRVPAVIAEMYAGLLAGPVAVLRSLGLDCTLRAINEIEVDGRRIAGIGGGRIGEAAVMVGNFLLEFDHAVLPQVWRAPWAGFRELADRALRERLTTLTEALGSVSVNHLRSLLIEKFAETLGRPILPGALTCGEESLAAEVAQRLSSEGYLNLHAGRGSAPMNRLKIAAGVHIRADECAVEGRRVRAAFRLNDDVIAEARLESDPPGDWAVVERSLRGVPFSQWREVLLGA